MDITNFEKDFYSLEELFNEKTQEGRIYLCKWVESIEQIKKKKKRKNCTMFFYGIYNRRTEQVMHDKEREKIDICSDKIEIFREIFGNGKTGDNSNNSIYDKLCSGLRFIELNILNSIKYLQYDEKDIIEEKSKESVICLYEGKYRYDLSDVLQQISLFLEGKRERVILSFHEDFQNVDTKKEEEKKSTSEENIIISESAVQQLDTYMYLYLRKYLCIHNNYSNSNENVKRDSFSTTNREDEAYLAKPEVLYFYNDRKRILDLSKYMYDMDNFQVKNWIFNNISLFFPSEKVVDKVEENKNFKKVPYLNSVNNHINKKDRKFLAINDNCNYKENNNSRLTQELHLSLFRLNSITENEISNLSEKILIKKKLPNICVYNGINFCSTPYCQKNYIFNSDMNKTNFLSNSCIFYLEFQVNECDVQFKDNQTSYIRETDLKKIYVCDDNFNANGNFIGYNKIPLIEYKIDMPKKVHFVESPFIFTKEKLKYIHEILGKNDLINSKNPYYVVKIDNNDNLETILINIQKKLDKINAPQFVAILKKKYDIYDICFLIKYNLKNVFTY